MKTLFLFLLMILFLQVNISAQVYNGDLVLESQFDVNSFNYTEVTGNLTIEEIGSGDITNLNGLSELVSVGGFFDLDDNNALTNIDGLSNLISVGGRFTIYQNDGLTNIDGLFNLTNIGGTLSIFQNAALINLDGLNSLNYIGGDLQINANASLTNIEGLSNLSWIIGDLIIAHTSVLNNLDGLSEITSVQNLNFHTASGLTDIDGLSSLDSIRGDFTMSGCQVLPNLDGLSNLDYIGGNLNLSGNGLTNIDGLSGISSVGGGVSLQFNHVLSNIDPLSNFPSVQALYIINNDALQYLQFDNLISIGGDLKIIDNDALPNLDGLTSLLTITGDVEISENDILTSVFGLYQLNSIGGGLKVKDNNSLPVIEGFPFIGSLTGDFEISGNPLLDNIDQFENLGTVGGNLLIKNNSALTYIPLSGLTSVGGRFNVSENNLVTDIYISELTSITNDMVIHKNNALVNIDGINLATIGRFLVIDSNSTIININGLSNLSSIGGLTILGNPLLNNIDAILNITAVGDSITIGNSPALNNLNGLSNITSVGEDLSIINNDAIVNLDGLTNLTSVGGNLNILNNNSLGELCGLTSLLTGNGLVGSYNVSGNGANPSQAQIIAGLCSASANAFFMTLGSDDVMYYNGATNNNASRFGETNNVYRGIEQIYKNVTIPQGAVITSAILEVKANSSTTGVVVSDIFSDSRDNPQTVMSYSEFNSNTNFSTASTQHTSPDYTIGNFYQVDITTLVQDRVNKPDWTEGDNLGILIKGNTALSSNNFRDITRAEQSLADNKLIITYNVSIPSIYIGDLTLTSQAEVDAFNYTSVTGNLTIFDIVDGNITNLDGLSELTSIGHSIFGDLSIISNKALANINGLSNLTTVSRIFIHSNDSLSNVNGLFNIDSLRGALSIQNNPSLSNVDGLSSLIYLGEFFTLKNNISLSNIDGLSNLTRINGDLDLSGNITLLNLDGLINLNSVHSLLIRNNNSLININGLKNLDQVSPDLFVQNNIALVEFCGLYNLLNRNGLVGFLYISGNGSNPSESEIINNGPCGIINSFYMTSGSDDIMYYNGSANKNVSRLGETNDLYRGIEQIYKNITIPQNTVITSALLEIKANTSGSGVVVSDFYTDLRDNPQTVMSYNDFNANLNFSSISYQYVAPDFIVGNSYQIDITNIIQDKINKPNWNEGDNLGILIKGNTLLSNNFRDITRAEQSLTDNKLIITYNSGLPKFVSGDEVVIIPNEYGLHQNYPNPFNPNTIISWQLPVASQVSLKVYDILGNEVANLVDENMEAGFYETSFDGSSLASGVYVYRLTAGNYVSTKKMLMVK